MKYVSRLAVLFAFVLALAARAEGPDDEYLGIYYLIQEADSLADKGQFAPALAKYTEAETALKKFQTEFPDWYGNVVGFRMRYLDEKIAEVGPKVPPPLPPKPPEPVSAPTPEPAPVSTAVAAVVAAGAAQAAPQPTNGAESTIRDLEEQLRQATSDKMVLEGKLKEALAVQPASLDPRELSLAQAQIRDLQKENALYLTGLEESRSRRVQIALEGNANDSMRLQLRDAQQKADELSRANTELTAANAALAKQAAQPPAADSTTQALRDENNVLKQQLAQLTAKPRAAAPDAGHNLRAAEARVAALQSDMNILRLENSALEKRINPSTPAGASAVAPDSEDGNASRIRALEAQRDDLQRRLDTALSRIASGNPGRDASAGADQTSRQLSDLRARLAILEARPVPYTPDELTLISPPGATAMSATAHVSGRKFPDELPPKAAALLADAKRDVANHDLDKAEDKYLQILKYNEKNVATLADLASIQVELGHLTDAEKHITTALAIDPDNEYSLFVMGRLRFRQNKFDGALDALSRAAELNPDNAEIQNYLGITLSEKGLRVPAEAALRKAVEIDPGYASAHANLAFVYITAQPPLPELARWHYEKALAAGYPPNPSIEKLLSPAKSVPAGQ